MKLKHTIPYYFLGTLMVLTAALIVMAPFLYQSHFVTYYSVHLMLLLFFGSLLMMKFKKVKLMFLGLFCTMIVALFLKDASNTDLKLPEQNEEAKVRVAHFNLGNIDTDLSTLQDLLTQDSIDIVSFQEYSPQWDADIKNVLREKFHYFKTVVRIDPYGVALFSKIPYIVADTFMLDGKPSLEMVVNKNNKSFNIISSYVVPSLNKKSTIDAVNQLNRIARQVNMSSDPVIALGEYNMVYWSYELRTFVDKAKLKNSRRSIMDNNLRIPYDHIFYSESLQCTDFKELKDPLDNHIGIVGTYQHLSKDQKKLNKLTHTVKG